MAGMSPYVGVRFGGKDDTIYSYRNHIPDLVAGDLVVVENPEGTFKVVRVEQLHLPKGKRKLATKWLVDRVRLDKYLALTALVPPPAKDD